MEQRLADEYSREARNHSSATLLFAKNAGQPIPEALNREADLATAKTGWPA
jgi:hypothetical protein